MYDMSQWRDSGLVRVRIRRQWDDEKELEQTSRKTSKRRT